MSSEHLPRRSAPVVFRLAVIAVLIAFPIDTALAFTSSMNENICFASFQGTPVPATAEETEQRNETDYRAAHKYLGYATLVMGGLAAVSASTHSLHRAASYAAIGLGSGTVATGFKEYGGYIDLSDGLSAYDIHAILGTVGVIAFTAAVAAAEAEDDGGSHAGFGVGSAVSMGLSVIVLKW